MAFTALYDACVLYPAPLRDLLLMIAQTGLFRARWTEQIHDEWIGNLVANRPELAEPLKSTRNKMNESVLDCLVTGYEPLVEAVQLPDKDDRHVLAAAIAGRANVIVTYNLKDFPESALKQYGIEAEHPDRFISNLFDLSPALIAGQVKAIRARLKKPPRTIDELLDTYLSLGLPETVSDLRTMKELL